MSAIDKWRHNVNILRKRQLLPRPHYFYMLYEKRKMEQAGAKYFLKSIREGDYFYHVTDYATVKKIVGSRIKADRHGRGTVSFTTNPLRYLGPFTGFYPINNAYIKIPMERVPNAFPVVYWLNEYEAKELSEELKRHLIPMEDFERLFAEYGLAWPAYIYPFIWAFENEWRVLGDFKPPWEYVTIGVSNYQQKTALEDYWIYLKGKVFVDENLRKIFKKKWME